MSNIIDYIKWRGDLSFNQSEFNEIDNLILARFSYFCLDGAIKENEKMTIKQAYENTEEIGIPEQKILQIEDKDLFPAMAKSKRFGKLYIIEYVNNVDEDEEKQFSAVTILLPDNTMYVAYRGTDNTLVGWKEDFNMCFSSNVPSQLAATQYLEKVSKLNKRKIRVGGHSKGGNLAIYAAVFANDSVKNRIINVYNNDGPGMSSDIIEKQEYKDMVNKIYTYVPQSSIIGRLLYHEEKYKVIESTQTGIMQHDLYSWQLEGKKFTYLEELTKESKVADKVIKGWLNGISPERRQEFVDILYQILITTNAQTLKEFSNNWLKNASICLKAYTTSNEEDKKIISDTLVKLFGITKNNLWDSMQESRKEKKLISEQKKIAN